MHGTWLGYSPSDAAGTDGLLVVLGRLLLVLCLLGLKVSLIEILFCSDEFVRS